jgi:hypothetical protein
MLPRLLFLSLAGVLLSACASDADSISAVRESLSIPNTGFIPYPVNPGEKPTPLWDGSVAELMAADAYAQCAQGAEESLFPALFGDYSIHQLLMKMYSARCSKMPSQSEGATSDWLKQRTTLPECNIDPASGANTTLQKIAHDRTGYTVPTVAELGISASGQTLPTEVRIEAQREVDVAEVNLCMAQLLREQLATAHALFASVDDQIALLSVIRERAQMSMLQYANLGRVYASPQVVTSVSHPLQYLPLLKAWGNSDSAAMKAQGEDFAAAIRLHVDATHELAEMLLRRDTKDSSGTAASTDAERDWGIYSGRQRLLSLLYGGSGVLSLPPWLTRPDREELRLEDVTDPKVHQLLALARSADALKLIEGDVAVGGSTLQARPVAPVAGNLMYVSVEAHLRATACMGTAATTADCSRETIAASIPPIESFSSYKLWTDHAIAPDHAQALARMLFEAMPRVRGGNRVLVGRHYFLGQHSLDANGWYHLDPGFAISPLHVAERATVFPPYYTPATVDLSLNPREQGFVARFYDTLNANMKVGVNADCMLELGAVPALALARDAISEGKGTSSPFYAAPTKALSLITAAIGARTVSIRPKMQPVDATGADCAFWDYKNVRPATCRTLTRSTDSSGQAVFDVHVVTNAADAFSVVAYGEVEGEPVEAALDPNYRSFTGATSPEIIGDLRTVEASASVQVGDGMVRRRYELFEPVEALLLKREGEAEGYQPIMRRYSDIRFQSTVTSLPRSFSAYYLGDAGTLTQAMQKAWASQVHNWSRPRYDAFGLPVAWFPPSAPELLNNEHGPTSAAYYLSAARNAAEQATLAVKQATENLLNQAWDTAALDIARERSAGLDSLEQRALCGDNNPDCSVNLKWAYGPELSCNHLVFTNAQKWCKELLVSIKQISPRGFPLAGPVADRAQEQKVPMFTEYSGGKLQKLFIEQWAAFDAWRRARSDAFAVVNERAAAVTAANAALWATQNSANYLCSVDAFRNAVDASFSRTTSLTNLKCVNGEEVPYYYYALKTQEESTDPPSDPVEYFTNFFRDYDPDPDNPYELVQADYCPTTNVFASADKTDVAYNIPSNEEGVSFNPGPMYAAQSACNQASMELGPAAAASAATIASAYGTVALQLSNVAARVGEVRRTTAAVWETVQATQLAKARNALEVELAAKGLRTRFGLARRYQSYDIWRARALLDSARRLAVTARRAIEARFVVDLGKMRDPETYVAAPALWVDEIYTPDLNAPAAVGLSVTPQMVDAIYPNKLLDYIGNLERFVEGYAVTRPTSVARRDAEVLVLPGPDTRRTATLEETDVEVLGEGGVQWAFYCGATGTWVPHPGLNEIPIVSSAATACEGQPPSRASVHFSLDPWARFTQAGEGTPFVDRYNTRWGRLAVNLVGTGVRDCRQAADPLTCYNESYVRFDLSQTGPAWVTTYDRSWLAFQITQARIEQGKALSAEEWLDPVVQGWNSPLANAIARHELAERPINGTYELTLHLTPDVRIDRIERVQLLIETDYWVRQR